MQILVVRKMKVGKRYYAINPRFNEIRTFTLLRHINDSFETDEGLMYFNDWKIFDTLEDLEYWRADHEGQKDLGF